MQMRLCPLKTSIKEKGVFQTKNTLRQMLNGIEIKQKPNSSIQSESNEKKYSKKKNFEITSKNFDWIPHAHQKKTTMIRRKRWEETESSIWMEIRNKSNLKGLL